MSDQMPERIWAWEPSPDEGHWGDDPVFWEEQGATEYVRADLVRQARLEELKKLERSFRASGWTKYSGRSVADAVRMRIHELERKGLRDE